jgi:methionyl-tRNA synthetase
MSKIVSTSIPYVNAKPHIGHALEYVETDAYVRHLRLQGDDVLFITGTDDNALKNVQAAQAAGEPVQQFVDAHAEEFKKLCTSLGIDEHVFVRTSGNEAHTKTAQAIWEACNKRGDLIKKTYSGYYCVGCEEFKTEKDLVDGACPIHPGKPLELVSEENYFFTLGKYQEKLEKLLVDDVLKIVPTSRKNEMLAFIRGGLEDFSVSRSVARAHGWGIPVPGDDSQIMYVWFDALINYLTGTGFPETTTWADATERTHFVGKDITRFHAIYWPAMLMSAGVELPTHLFSHGFITSGGQKMSKSIGNVISPDDLIKKYGTEATRYLLLRHVHPTEDTDITWERLDEWYTANLVNGLGNLVARVMKLVETSLDAYSAIDSTREVTEALEEFNFQQAMDSIWGRIQRLDQKITETEPFKVIKVDEVKGKALLEELRIELVLIARRLKPFMPETSNLIHDSVVVANKKPENLFPRLT